MHETISRKDSLNSVSFRFHRLEEQGSCKRSVFLRCFRVSVSSKMLGFLFGMRLVLMKVVNTRSTSSFSLSENAYEHVCLYVRSASRAFDFT